MTEAARIHGNQKEKRRGDGDYHWRRRSTKTMMKDSHLLIDRFSKSTCFVRFSLLPRVFLRRLGLVTASPSCVGCLIFLSPTLFSSSLLLFFVFFGVDFVEFGV